MRLGIPRIVRAAVMGVVAGAAESKFDHVGLAHHRRQLPAQRGDHRSIDFEIRRQALSRPCMGRKARNREQVLDRGRNALQRPSARSHGKSGIGRVGASSRMLGCPLRIGHELAAETFVIGDCGFDEIAGFELALVKQDRNLGYRLRQCIGHADVPHRQFGGNSVLKLGWQRQAGRIDVGSLICL